MNCFRGGIFKTKNIFEKVFSNKTCFDWFVGVVKFVSRPFPYFSRLGVLCLGVLVSWCLGVLVSWCLVLCLGVLCLGVLCLVSWCLVSCVSCVLCLVCLLSWCLVSCVSCVLCLACVSCVSCVACGLSCLVLAWFGLVCLGLACLVCLVLSLQLDYFKSLYCKTILSFLLSYFIV